mgnify:CR=1 FL=1
MTPISNGTRIRTDHNVYSAVLTSVNADVVVTGNELWIAPADGNEVKAGDKWVKVTYGMFTGWMAYIHKGVPICDNFAATDVPPPVEPPVVSPIFPDYYDLVSPDGSKVRYFKEA